ncbi:MAG: CO dehydrogenase/acetyl-CoA synthase complex subunit epsilon [Candidatus Lokiarchaeota archaeon]|nr:CO dehydrogenase/acetyl-CoA synthase complex subunit epsilon [Candidatus Lokiarchaeota archaeon]MBD3338327.1 CO dehydrogenase/acetyl-CoA synthase complex subunit epsilon [Candidatus Lokiarchaeota archaeon]
MSKKGAKLKIDSYKGPLGSIKGFELTAGKVSYGDETEWEPMGPTPRPHIPTLREWFFKLMDRYKPYYMPICDMCCLCTYGKCNLSKGRTGACGINMETQQARIVEIACCIGASCHSAHGDHLLHWLKEKYGNVPINFGNNIAVEMPMVRLIVGMKPETLEDLESAMEWVQFTITHLLAAGHTGQEASYKDYESKAFLAGLADAVGMEISDAVQIAAYGFPMGEPEVPIVELGMGTLDTENKATILMIGHNVAPGIELVDYMREKGVDDKVDVGAICCTALDLTRYYDGAKIVGSLSRQMFYIRSGLADVVMVDEQCVNLRSYEQAKLVDAPFIATNEKIMAGLPNRTDDPAEEIIDDLVSGKADGVLILDPVKAGKVAVETAIKVKPLRKAKSAVPDEKGCIEMALRCNGCGNCQRNCPNDLPLVEGVNLVKQGDFSVLSEAFDSCLDCGRCEADCMKEVSPLTLIMYAGREKIRSETFNCRVGRGPIQDTEIRNVGAPIVLGEIPGIVAIIGCANYGKEIQELYTMAEEFCKRNYIVVVSGCGAMDIGLVKDEDGKTLYDRYPGDFDRGGLVNVGSCVSNPHINGAAVKVANIFARRPLRGNYEEIADYVLNRVGACGVAWGAMSQKAASIASSCNGMGIPAVLGPHSAEYRRMYIGRADDDETWKVWNARDATPDHLVGPGPEHLLTTAESIEQAICLVAKMCLRPADNSKGRMIKLSHWIDLERKYKGVEFPEDLDKFIRVESDIPIQMKDGIMEYLKEKGWEPREIVDPTLLERLCHT